MILPVATVIMTRIVHIFVLYTSLFYFYPLLGETTPRGVLRDLIFIKWDEGHFLTFTRI